MLSLRTSSIYVSWLGVYLLEAYRIFADVFRINKAFSLCKVVANLLFQ